MLKRLYRSQVKNNQMVWILYNTLPAQLIHTADVGVNIQVFNMLKTHVMETMISCKLVEGKYTESLNMVMHLCIYT